MGNITSSFVFYPPEVNDKLDFTFKTKIIKIKTNTKKNIEAFYFQTKDTKKHILYSHANACDIRQTYDFIEKLHLYLNINILLYEYIGYGKNQEKYLLKEIDTKEKDISSYKSTEDTIYESADAAMNFLLNEKKINLSDIIIMGTSIGTGPAIYLASKYSGLNGLILETPFLSIMKILPYTNIISYIYDMFENFKKIKNVTCDVLIIHGDKDEVIPVGHSILLHEEIKDICNIIIVKGGRHDNVRTSMGNNEQNQPKYLLTIKKFIEDHKNVNNINKKFSIKIDDINTIKKRNINNESIENDEKK